MCRIFTNINFEKQVLSRNFFVFKLSEPHHASLAETKGAGTKIIEVTRAPYVILFLGVVQLQLRMS